MSCIEVNDLKKTFGKKTVLQSLNLSVPKGSIFGLLGANGCGKTTLIRILAGLDFRDEGTVAVLGNSDPEEYRRKIGFMLASKRMRFSAERFSASHCTDTMELFIFILDISKSP